METMLIGINSKFIHPNLAIRLLKQNSPHEIFLKEFTIKDNPEEIIKFINENPIKVIGISVYIWNVEMIKYILPKIKNKTIILGGPEVSYDSNHYFEYGVDFIIKGEGEESFNKLMSCLDNSTDYSKVEGLSFKDSNVISNPIVEMNIDTIKYANHIDFDKAQIQYIETSRGCPFKCSYCLASLELSVRYFELKKVKENILDLINKNAKIFKFLDRTFNLNTKHSKEIINFIIENHKPGNVFQFEITGDILKDELLDLVHTAPKGLFRFEIGIQSTNLKTNQEVDRIQNTEKLFEIIKTIQKNGIVDLHLDLIAGLPYENLESFKNTFNQTFDLKSKELQLGFLTMLPGTKIRREANKHNYEYQKTSPYEITSNNHLSSEDIKSIKTVEEVLERYWNKGFMNKSMEYIIKDPFEFFLNFGKYYESKYSWFDYQLGDLFTRILEFTNDRFDPKIKELLIYDYLNYHNCKPKKWWEPISKSERNNILRSFSMTNNEYTIDELYKYAIVEKVTNYIICVYKPNNKNIYVVQNV